MKRVLAYLDPDIRIGDICAMFEGNTNIYSYRLAVDDNGSIVITEP